MCKQSCNECPNKIFSAGVSVTAVAGVNTLVINIPSQSFRNGQRGCLVITQSIPDTATINMPVAITIGTSTVTYPVVKCSCAQVTACAIRSRRRYPFKVSTNATGGVFKISRNLSCSPNNALSSIPVADTTTTDPIGG